MPKELRKRGKRAKKSQRETEEDSYIVYARPDDKDEHRAAVTGEAVKDEEDGRRRQKQDEQQLDSLLSVGDKSQSSNQASAESQWPQVDPDTKGYFRQLEEKIIELEELNAYGRAKVLNQDDEQDGDLDERVLLLRAALTQLSGKETALATDAETSVILERLIFSMDDFARRVLADRFAGQYKELAKDRFASHVLQTLLVLGGGETVERERRGTVATAPAFGESSTSTVGDDVGTLPSMTDALQSITQELLEDIPSIIHSQHGSYILRIILLVLAGKPLPFTSESSTGQQGGAAGRSKRSAKWKHRKAGNMRSILPGNVQQDSFPAGKGKAPETRIVPAPFSKLLQTLCASIDAALCKGYPKHSKEASYECRIRTDDPTTTGLVQILLELEHDAGKSEEEHSLMDRLLEGLVTDLRRDPSLSQPARTDYVEALLRSTVSSHVLEKIISLASVPLFDLLFKMYFVGRIGRLAGHPVANFVCARVAERANSDQTGIFIDEIEQALAGCIENSRTGVIQTLIEKSAQHKVKGDQLSKSLLNAFQTRNEEDIKHLLPCGLALMTLALYRRNPAFNDASSKLEYHMQGALLLQAWLRLPGSPVVRSILETPLDRLFNYTSDPVASRVIDVFLDENNTAVSHKDRRNFQKSLIGHYQQLADDRIGSRVAERCWEAADPFLKDKIAASLVPAEYQLLNSQYGHFFLRKVNLPLYKRDKWEWKDRHSKGQGGTPAELHARAAKAQAANSAVQHGNNVKSAEGEATAQADSAKPDKEKKKKRKKDKADEIDELFDSSKRRALGPANGPTQASVPPKHEKRESDNLGLDDDIMSALKAAKKVTRKE